MTLKEWEQTSGRKVNHSPTNTNKAWVPDFSDSKIRATLWNLDDYVVDSISGGTIWLSKLDKEYLR